MTGAPASWMQHAPRCVVIRATPPLVQRQVPTACSLHVFLIPMLLMRRFETRMMIVATCVIPCTALPVPALTCHPRCAKSLPASTCAMAGASLLILMRRLLVHRSLMAPWSRSTLGMTTSLAIHAVWWTWQRLLLPRCEHGTSSPQFWRDSRHAALHVLHFVLNWSFWLLCAAPAQLQVRISSHASKSGAEVHLAC